uniref:legumain n=1 Tax=Angiostrongylus cantonensis TaxID=6313 RepID=R4TUW8_ANGCA|nr:asparaginyl endopeptidase [Angiostrongylus cantonensis]
MAVLLWTFFFTLLCLGGAVEVQNAQSSANQKADIHVLLVAGSNGWWNYRHQADIAHAYHLMRNNGIPESNIIVMMYDDIANDPDNPYPGKLFNKPHGPDVYHGVKIDYKGDSVNPKNFLSVLQGKSNGVSGGNGRVLNSTANDRVFVYFADHGSDGLICFPNDIWSKHDLNKALQEMHEKKQYGQLVFYLEACESGSMFEGTLDKKMNIYAVTAANAVESSWGTYCYNDMNLPCLGDLFSVNWIEDSETHNINVETLMKQFDDVKKLTNLSHVMHYGNLKIATEPVRWFEGEVQTTVVPTTTTYDNVEGQYPKVSWPARDIELMHLQKLQETTNNALVSTALKQRITKIHEDRQKIEVVFKSLVANLLPNAEDRKQVMDGRNPVKDLKCHNDVVKAFDSICIDVNKFDYALKYIYMLNNLCVKVGDAEKIISSMHPTCSTIGDPYL